MHTEIWCTVGVAERCKPELASTRFRLLIPSKHVRGVKYTLGKGDVTIFPKHVVPLEDVTRWEGPTLWDVCDDHFDNPSLSDYYRAMPGLVDRVSCTTPYLAGRIKQVCGVDAVVISDPLEFPRREPKLERVENLFWYGHKTNLDPLLDLDTTGYNLVCVSNLDADWCLPWSSANMRKGYDWCDAVIIPVKQDLEQASALAKSPNRMTEAINAGRFVVANHMPAYDGYEMYLGDIREGLEWLKNNREEALQRLKKSQNLVETLHSPQVIARQWERVFSSMLGVETSSGPVS